MVAYNYFDDSRIWNFPTWQEVAFNASHFPGPHHVLFEGNAGPNFDSDNTHGSSYAITAFRNWFRGERRSFNPPGEALINGRTIGVSWGTRNVSAVGNVLGFPGMGARTYAGHPWTLECVSTPDPFYPADKPCVYKVGYDDGDWYITPDPAVTGSFIDKDNFNFLTNTIRTSAAPDAVPESLFLSAPPPFFGSCAWPWVTPTAAAPLGVLPARRRYEIGAADQPTLDVCATPLPARRLRR